MSFIRLNERQQRILALVEGNLVYRGSDYEYHVDEVLADDHVIARQLSSDIYVLADRRLIVLTRDGGIRITEYGILHYKHFGGRKKFRLKQFTMHVATGITA